MSNAAAQSGHWTDEQLIHQLYGVGDLAGDAHLRQCPQCAARFQALEQRRFALAAGETVSDDFLAAQRRAIYARLSEPHHWWNEVPLRRWAPIAAMLVVLAGSFTLYQQHQRELAEARADAQLAQEVSNMSMDGESAATAPLHALFVE